MSKLKTLDIVALVLVVVGGLNWGLVGFLRFDLVAWIFGGIEAPLSRAVYSLVGAAALFVLVIIRKLGKK
jgi:uncharacterized protein